MNYQVTIGGRTRDIMVHPAHGGGWRVTVDGGPERLVLGGPLGGAEWQLRDGDEVQTMGVSAGNGDVYLQIDGYPLRAKVVDPRQDALALGAAGSEGAVITEMPGVIVRLLVAPGDRVDEGQPVIVVEAMKMENELKAPTDGVVSVVYVKAGDRVDSGATLLTIDAAEDG
jgi:biotin carboxyl carrier protein